MNSNLEPRVQVEAYAGDSYLQWPLRVFWRDEWRDVLSVERQYLEPHHRCFIVLLEGPSAAQERGDIRLRLCYHYANNVWQAEPLASHREN